MTHAGDLVRRFLPRLGTRPADPVDPATMGTVFLLGEAIAEKAVRDKIPGEEFDALLDYMREHYRACTRSQVQSRRG